jgi:tRNA threonylcarbamoyladenosine biosynthesis protein TsaE
MKEEQTRQLESGNVKATLQIAAEIGKKLRGGEVIELRSDLGGGKTTFVRGLVKGAGNSDWVSSPSFTLSNEYNAGSITFYHFDFYRLGEPGIMAQELAEAISNPGSVTIIEWANIVEEVLPIKRLGVQISANGEQKRTLEFHYPEALAYLFGDI